MRRRWMIGISLALFAALASSVGWALHQGSPEGLNGRRGRLVEAVRAPAGADAVSEVSEVVLRSSTGQMIRALVRVPRGGAPPYPAMVLVDGLELGRRVAALSGLDAIARHVVIVSPDYPPQIDLRALGGFGLVGAAPRLREGAFDLVAQIGLQVDYLSSRPDVAGDRIFLVGSSFGAPAVVIAGGIDPRPVAVIALYGGGDIGGLISHALQQGAPGAVPTWRAALLGRTLALLLAPLEPTRYAARIAPRPLLMVNGAQDALIPRSSVDALYEAAREPKDILWIVGEHVQPDERELIGAVSGRIAAWLAARGLLPPEAARGE